MAFPLGKKGVLAALAVTGAAVFWRVRANRAEEERRWQEELDAATAEGIAAAHAARAATKSDAE